MITKCISVKYYYYYYYYYYYNEGIITTQTIYDIYV